MAVDYFDIAFRDTKGVGIHCFLFITGLNPFTLSHCGPSPPCVRFANIVAEADATLSTWCFARASRMGTCTPQTKPSFARRTSNGTENNAKAVNHTGNGFQRSIFRVFGVAKLYNPFTVWVSQNQTNFKDRLKLEFGGPE
jgi:hypothetical protein